MTAHVFEAAGWDRSAYGRRTFLSSETVSWSSALVEEVLNDPVAEVHVPATTDFQLALIVEGRGVIESRHGRGWARAHSTPGRVATIAPGRAPVLRWRSPPAEPQRTLHVSVPRTTMAEAAGLLGLGDDLEGVVPDFLDGSDRLVAATMIALRTAAEARADALYADAAAWHLAVHVLQTWSGRRAATKPVDDARIARVLDYVQDSLGDSVTIAGMAAVAGLSPYHFIRVFRAATGETPYRHVLRVRLETAARRLAGEPVSVTELAFECGFSSPSRFAAAFRGRYGISPTQYRVQLRG